ncbi:hypothetical protein ACH4PU_35955 [Streptomyces sp. NPDC021100]|uniref:hypothetical protein n=1 Tax=Streptomyces sp. NPDC021100 TaxID=3365114 RepID=UPI0037A09353
MPSYTVVWEIDLDAHDHTDAARRALAIQRDPRSWATCFAVHGTASTVHVDLSPDDPDPSGPGTPALTLAA